MSDSKLQSVSEIFNNRIFRIPDFQRGYSWGESQLEDFWEDIQNLNPGKIHYIGLLTVEPIKEEYIAKHDKWEDDRWLIDKGVSAYYIIDGQQRLTTLIILIHEILRTIRDDEGIMFGQKSEWIDKFLYHSFGKKYRSFVFGYEKDDPSNEFFKTKILEQISSAADKYPETLYTANLLFAKEYFAKKIKRLSPKNREEVFEKAIKRLKFNYYEVDSTLDVYITFETMNNRGKELSKLELLKNRLIYLTELLQEEEHIKICLRKDINETWKTIYEYLGKNKDNSLSDDDFLFNHWIMYFTYDRSKSAAYADFLLKEKFTAKNVLSKEVTAEDVKEYIDSLSDCVKKWYYLHNIQDSQYSDEIKEWTQKLERVGMGAFEPMLMAIFSKEKDENTICKLLKQCEKFNFLVFRLSHRPINTQNSRFFRMAKEYYSEGIDIDGVIDTITYLTYGNEESYGWFDLSQFENHIKDLFFRNEQGGGFYAWDGLRYFLYEYELYLQGSANEKVSWNDFRKRKKEDTIEHIYPQTPDDPYWKQRFGRFRKEKQNIMLNSLGNLLLLSRSKNSALQNDSFDKKCCREKNGKKMGYRNGSYSEIEVAGEKEWTANEIMIRGKKMLEFMENRWDFRFKDWNIKMEDILQPTKR